MANSNTKHSKKLRAESAKKAREKALADGGIVISAIVRKEDGADILRKLVAEHGSKGAAIRYLIRFYQKNI